MGYKGDEGEQVVKRKWDIRENSGTKENGR